MKVVLKLTAVLIVILLAVVGSMLIAGILDSNSAANIIVRGGLIIVVPGVASAVIRFLVGNRDSSDKPQSKFLLKQF